MCCWLLHIYIGPLEQPFVAIKHHRGNEAEVNFCIPRCWGNASQIKLAQLMTIVSHSPFTLKNLK